MKTILRILERAGDYRPTLYLKIENSPYMALVIEATPEPGPTGLPAISIAHYGEQNDDLMRDPEMCFELTNPLGMGWTMTAYYFRNDYMGVEQYSRILLSMHNQADAAKILRDAAHVYRVDLDAISATVKQEFVAKDKGKANKKATPKSAPKPAKKAAA